MPFSFQLLIESFLSALVLPVYNPTTFFAMRSFGGYDMAVPALISTTGAFAAQGVNFAFGRLLRHLRRQGQIYLRDDIYAKGGWLARTWLLPLLLLTWVPFGSLLAVLAGFFNVPMKRAFPLLLIGWAGCYGWWALG